MPLLSFEGVEVELPPSLDGLRFSFLNGKLAIECSQFTGTIALAKGTSDRSTPTKATSSPTKSSTSPSHPTHRSTSACTASSTSSTRPSPAKAGILDVNDVNDAFLPFPARVKPNFLNQIEQSMLLAQFEATQQPPASQSQSQSQSQASAAPVDTKENMVPSLLLQALDKDEEEDDDEEEEDVLMAEPEPEQDELAPSDKENRAPDASDGEKHHQKHSKQQPKELRGPLKKKKRQASAAAVASTSSSSSPLRTRRRTHHQTTLLDSSSPSLPAAPAAAPGSSKPTSRVTKSRTTETTLKSTGTRALKSSGGAPTGGRKSPRAKGMTTKAKALHPILSTSHSNDNSTSTSTSTNRNSLPSQLARPIATVQTLPTHGVPPVERWGHTATRISSSQVVLYGGANDEEATLNDLLVLDLVKNEWSRPLNCESIPRAWHDTVFLESKNLLLVFGGERSVGKATEALADIMVLDTQCFLWYPPAVTGVPPTSRSGHSCTAVGNDVVVFGGSKGRTRQNSVFVLDTEQWNWRTLRIDGKPPSPRTYHSAVCVGESVVIFGGNDAKTSFNSVHVLRRKDPHAGATTATTTTTTTTTATTSTSTHHGNTWSWFHPCVVGAVLPCPRTGHSATVVNDHCVLIFGGWDPQSEDGKPGGHYAKNAVFDDAFLLNTLTWEWHQVTLQPEPNPEQVATAKDDEDPLVGRVGHRAVWDESGHRVLLFGGQDSHEKRRNVVQAIHLGLDGDDTANQRAGRKGNPIQL